MKHDDAELIERTLEGDQHAFTALVEKYQEQIHALAWQKIGDFHIAQEITQDAFITAYQKLSTLTHHSRFAGWLYVITSNKCNMWHRKKKTKPQSLEETDPMELEEVYYSEYMSQQREEAANQNRRTIVRKLLSKLRESERTVVTMHYLAGLTCEEIGKFLGVSPNTVKSRLHRARERLKKEEAVIQENLSSFQLPAQMTENIMKEISRLNPVTPSGSKPLVPLAISAASAILVVLLIGFGAQNLIRFQKPYSLEATSEQKVEIVDTPIVLESSVKPAIDNQVSRSDVLSNNDGSGQEPETSLFAAAQSDDAESNKFKGSWSQTSGPYGGKILTLYETTNDVLLAGTDGAGVFRSTDHGNSWAPVNTGLYNEPDGRSLTVSAIAEKGDKIYIGTQEALYISTDIGNTWQPVSAIQVPGKISGIVILDDHIYVSTLLKGVWQSNDGNSWVQINDGLGTTFHGMFLENDPRLNPNPIDVKPMYVFRLSSVGTTLVAATKKGLFRRTGNEDTWTPIKPVVVEHSDGVESENNSKDKPESNPSPKQDSSSDLYVESLASMKHLLFLSGSMGKKSGIFRSNDVGDTWTLIIPEKVKEESDDVQTITVQGERVYAGTNDGLIYLSNDMGDSWISINDGVMYDDVLTLLPINDNTVFIGTSDNGVFRTTDAGDSWVECNTGIINTDVRKLEVIGDKLYTVVGKNIVYSADGGDTWLPINDPSKQSKYAYFSPTFCVSDGELYIGGYFGDDKFILPSHSGGEGGSVYRLNRENNTLVELFTHRDLSLIESMDGIGNTFYMGTGSSGVFKWDQKTGITKLGLERHRISVLSANSENVIAVIGDSEIHRFKENRWEPIHTAEMIDGGLTDLKRVGSTLYATCYDKGVFRSKDGGDTWTTINDGLDDTSATSIGTDGTEVYVSTFPDVTNVFQWIEEKQRWKSIGSFPKQVSSLAVVEDFLYAGTYGSGVYKIRLEK